MGSRLIPLYLPHPVYQELARQAADQDRDPIQQARFLLKRALRTTSQGSRHSAARPTIPTTEGTGLEPAGSHGESALARA